APAADDLGAPGSTAVVAARAALARPGPVAPGGTFEATVTLTIKSGWHVYANPTGTENLIPTTVSLAPGQHAKLVKVDYPAGQIKALEASGGEKAALYEGTAKLKVRIQLDGSSKEAPDSLKLQVRYQACNDRACLAPTSLAVPVSLKPKR